MPASGTWTAAMPGAVRLDLAEPLRTDPLAAHAVRRAVGRAVLSSRGNSSSSTATITLPQMSNGIFSRGRTPPSPLAGAAVLRLAASRADSRCPSGARPSCGRSDAWRRRLPFPARRPSCRETARESDSRRQADDAAADDDEVDAASSIRSTSLCTSNSPRSCGCGPSAWRRRRAVCRGRLWPGRCGGRRSRRGGPARIRGGRSRR